MLFIILLQQLAWCSPVVFAFHFISLSSRSTADCHFSSLGIWYDANSILLFILQTVLSNFKRQNLEQ